MPKKYPDTTHITMEKEKIKATMKYMGKIKYAAHGHSMN